MISVDTMTDPGEDRIFCDFEVLEKGLDQMIVGDVPPPPPPQDPLMLLNGYEDRPNEEGHEPSQAIFCETCAHWFNGPTQWKDHMISKKHHKNRKRGKSRWEQEYRDKDVHVKTGILIATKAI